MQPGNNLKALFWRNVVKYAIEHDMMDDLRDEMTGSYYKALAHDYNPTLEKVEKIARALDVDFKTMLTWFD